MSRFLFVLLLAGSACVPQSKYDALQSEYDKTMAANDRLRQQVATLEAREAARQKAYKELLEDLKPLIDRGVLKVSMEGDRVLIGMASDVLFSSGSADLSADGASTVAELARALARRASDHDFQVEGHTDSEPISTAQFPSNWHLGAARALTVTRKMIDSGFPAKHLSAASFGDQHPVASNGTEAGRAQNRRIEVVLLPDLSTVPGVGAPSTPPRQGPRPPKKH